VKIRLQHAHGLGPAPRQQHRHLALPPQPDELGEQHDRRQRDAQAGQDDVESKGRGHLGPGRDDLPARPGGG
jgi:hypothetical protein